MTTTKTNKNAKNEYADKWRKNYDQLTCADQRKVYDSYGGDYLSSETEMPSEWFNDHIGYNKELPFKFFDYVCSKRKKLRVIELGGAVGQLANAVLEKHSEHIEVWRNYEIQSHAITNNVCMHNQYEPIVPDKFFWELDDIGKNWDVFFCSHTIEHIKEDQVRKIFDRISMVDFIYLESPICDDSTKQSKYSNVNHFFVNCAALHILEIGWKQITDMLPDFRTIGGLSTPYILGTVWHEGFNVKVIYYKGHLFPLGLLNGYSVLLSGRGVVGYNTPKNNGEVRVLERKPEGYVEPSDSEKEKLNKTMYLAAMKKHGWKRLVRLPVSPHGSS